MISLPIITSIIFGFLAAFVLYDLLDNLLHKCKLSKGDTVAMLIFIWTIVSSWVLYFK